MGVQTNPVALIYREIRQAIFFNFAKEAHEIFQGDFEIDESYFGGVRKDKRGRGAVGKVVVFGIRKRHGKVYTLVMENITIKTLMKEIAHNIKPDCVA